MSDSLIYYFCNMSLRVVVLGAENVGKSGKFLIKIDFYLILNLMENIFTLYVYVLSMTTL